MQNVTGQPMSPYIASSQMENPIQTLPASPQLSSQGYGSQLPSPAWTGSPVRQSSPSPSMDPYRQTATRYHQGSYATQQNTSEMPQYMNPSNSHNSNTSAYNSQYPAPVQSNYPGAALQQNYPGNLKTNYGSAYYGNVAQQSNYTNESVNVRQSNYPGSTFYQTKKQQCASPSMPQTSSHSTLPVSQASYPAKQQSVQYARYVSNYSAYNSENQQGYSTKHYSSSQVSSSSTSMPTITSTQTNGQLSSIPTPPETTAPGDLPGSDGSGIDAMVDCGKLNQVSSSSFVLPGTTVAYSSTGFSSSNTNVMTTVSNGLEYSRLQNWNNTGAPVQPPPNVDEGSQASSASASSSIPDEQNSVKTNSKPNFSYPPTPNTLSSPGAASMSSFHDDLECISSPGWPRTPASPVAPNNNSNYEFANIKRPESLLKLYSLSDEPDRRYFLDKLIVFNEDRGSPMNQCPTISKQPLDVFRVYLAVKERGGFVEVTNSKRWKDVAGAIGVGASSSAAYTLRKQYMKLLLPFECKYDRGGIDPQPIINQVEATSRKKGKNSTSGNQNMCLPGYHQSMDGYHSSAYTDCYPSSRYPCNTNNVDYRYAQNTSHYPQAMHHQPSNSPISSQPQYSQYARNCQPPYGYYSGNNNSVPPAYSNSHQSNMNSNMCRYSVSSTAPSQATCVPDSNYCPTNYAPHQQSYATQGNNSYKYNYNDPESSGNIQANRTSNQMQSVSYESYIASNNSVSVKTTVSVDEADSKPSADSFDDSANDSSLSSGNSNSLDNLNYTQSTPAKSTFHEQCISSPVNCATPKPNVQLFQSAAIESKSYVSSCPARVAAPSATLVEPPTSAPIHQQPMPVPATMQLPQVVGTPPPQQLAPSRQMTPTSPRQTTPTLLHQGTPPTPPRQLTPTLPQQAMSTPPRQVTPTLQHQRPATPPRQATPTLQHQIPATPPRQATPTLQHQIPATPPRQATPTLPHQIPATPPRQATPTLQHQVPATPPRQATPTLQHQTYGTLPRQVVPTMTQATPPWQHQVTSAPLRQVPPRQPTPSMPYQAGPPRQASVLLNQVPPTPQASLSQVRQSSSLLVQSGAVPQPSFGSTSSTPSLGCNYPQSAPYHNAVQQKTPLSQAGHYNQYSNVPSDNCKASENLPTYPAQQQVKYNSPKDMQNTYPSTYYGNSQLQKSAYGNYTNYANTQMESKEQYQMNCYKPSYSNSPSKSARGWSNNSSYPYQSDTVNTRPVPSTNSVENKHFPENSKSSKSLGNSCVTQQMENKATSRSLTSSPHIHHIQPFKPQMQPNAAASAPPTVHNYAPPQKKPIEFPPDSIEAIKPNFRKRRRYSAKRVSPVDPWKMMLSLKSGLLVESTWALNALSVLLCDNSSAVYLRLSHLPGLLSVLVEHYRHYLNKIFGLFGDLELVCTNKKKPGGNISKSSKSGDSAKDGLSANCRVGKRKSAINLSEKSKVLDAPNYSFKTRCNKMVNIHYDEALFLIDPDQKWDKYEGFDFDPNHWQNGCGDITEHIATPPKSISGKVKFARDMDAEKPKVINGSKHGGPLPLKRIPDDLREEFKSKRLSLPSKGEPIVVLKKCDFWQKRSSSKDSKSDEILNSDTENSRTSTENDTDESSMKTSSDSKNSSSSCSSTSSRKIALDFTSLNIKSVDAEKSDGAVNGLLLRKDENVLSSSSSVNTSAQISSDLKLSEGTGKPESNVAKNEANTKNDFMGSFPRLRCPSGVKRVCLEELEDEAYICEKPSLNLLAEHQEELIRHCMCVSNILRNLSFIPGNDLEMNKHPALLLILGHLLLLHHKHKPIRPAHRKYDKESDGSEPDDSCTSLKEYSEWWQNLIHVLRDNTLVILSNISGQLDLTPFPEEISLTILDGLLHWVVCPSSYARDPLPVKPSLSVLTPQRLSLEILSKISVLDNNVDLMIATPPWSRIEQLFEFLAKSLTPGEDKVVREFSIVLLSNLSQADLCVARTIANQSNCISYLIAFIEQVESSAFQIASTQGTKRLRDNPEIVGTTPNMVERAANILKNLAMVRENQTVFFRYQQRLLTLATSQIIDQELAVIIADVLFYCSSWDADASTDPFVVS